MMTVSQHAMCRGVSAQRGCLSRGGVCPEAGVCPEGGGVSASGPGGVCPEGCLPRGVCPGGVCPGRCLPREVSAQRGVSASDPGGGIPACNGADPPPWTDRNLWKHNLRKLRLRTVINIKSFNFQWNTHLHNTRTQYCRIPWTTWTARSAWVTRTTGPTWSGWGTRPTRTPRITWTKRSGWREGTSRSNWRTGLRWRQRPAGMIGFFFVLISTFS